MKKDTKKKKNSRECNIEEEVSELFEIDLDSDYPIHEAYVKEKKIRKMKQHALR